MLMRTEKQQKEWIRWYKRLYGDTSKELPTITKSEQKLHERMRKRKLRLIL